jgi:hypothetical protein
MGPSNQGLLAIRFRSGTRPTQELPKPNGVFTFIPFVLMGEGDSEVDTTAVVLEGRRSIFLHHLWAAFTADKIAAPFESWSAYVDALARPGIAVSSSSYYRAAYVSADQGRALVGEKLAIPVLAITGKEGIGANHKSLVRAFSSNLASNIIVPGAGHFLACGRTASRSRLGPGEVPRNLRLTSFCCCPPPFPLGSPTAEALGAVSEESRWNEVDYAAESRNGWNSATTRQVWSFETGPRAIQFEQILAGEGNSYFHKTLSQAGIEG